MQQGKNLYSNQSHVKLKSKEEVVKKLQENNLALEERFRLHKVDMEDITNSKTLAVDEWGHLSPGPYFMMEKKKAQR